jgi:hypothetical protein
VHADPRYARVRAVLDRNLTDLQDCRGKECSATIPPLPEPR